VEQTGVHHEDTTPLSPRTPKDLVSLVRTFVGGAASPSARRVATHECDAPSSVTVLDPAALDPFAAPDVGTRSIPILYKNSATL